MQEKEMLNDLIVESREHIQSIEPDLLELEQKGDQVGDELVNRVFRAVHSIKGGFGFFGIETIVKLSHAMENVMALVRDKKVRITPELTDALLQGVDKLRFLLDDAANAERIAIDAELARLQPFLSGPGPSPVTPAAGRPEPVSGSQHLDKGDVRALHANLTETQMLDAIRNGKLLYQVAVLPPADFTADKPTVGAILAAWEKFGEILDAVPPRSQIERLSGADAPADISVVLATVLEPDLIADALGLPQERISTMDISAYKQRLHAEKQQAQLAAAGKQAAVATKTEAAVEESLRVKVGLLNNLMNFAGELVLSRNQLLQVLGRKFAETPDAERIVKALLDEARRAFSELAAASRTGSAQQVTDTALSRLDKKLRELLGFTIGSAQGVSAIAQNIDMVTTVLQENIMQTRMQPISVVFSKFPRVIRDLAKKVGKDIGLTLIGQEVELDKSIIELLSDPLTHLIRNCADHGIESPEARRRAGKSPKGEVVMRAHQESGKVIIEVHDDGAGIDPKMIRDKAIEKGVVSKEKASAMTDAELQLLIFAPGFSTAKQVSDVSGRGVGMDVVKTNIERLGGTVEVESEPGKGTTVVMKMPLTLAIIPSLIVETGDRRFAIPQMGLEEVVRIRGQDISKKVERVQNSEVLRLRGKLLPLIRLADALGMTRTFIHPGTGERLPDKRGRWSDRRGLPPGAHEDEDEAIAQEALPKDERRKGEQDRRKAIANAVKVIVLRTEKNRYGLVVEDVLDSEEIVVKPLPDYLKTTQCYAGATIMGDGKVAMILDPNGIATIANLRFVELEKDIEAEQERQRRKDQATLHNMVLFTLGGAERFATELGSIARIEKRAIQDIEVIGDREFVKYEDSSLRLLRLEHHLPISAPAARQSHVFVIVPKGGAKQAGIVVHKVEDTMMTELKLDTSSMRGPGVSGTSIIGKKMTIVLDMKRFLEAVQVE